MKARVDSKIAKLEESLAKLRAFREALDDPELRDILNEDKVSPRSRTTKHPLFGNETQTGKRSSRLFMKIEKFFRERKNQPATTREIREGTGLSRGAVSNVLYHQRKHDFSKVTIAATGVIQWRLDTKVGEPELMTPATHGGKPV